MPKVFRKTAREEGGRVKLVTCGSDVADDEAGEGGVIGRGVAGRRRRGGERAKPGGDTGGGGAEATGLEDVGAGVVAEGGKEDLRGTWEEGVVGVEKAEPAAADGGKGGVAGAGDAAVFGEGEEDEAGVAGEDVAEEVPGGGVGAVEDEEELGVAEGLRAERFGAGAEVGFGNAVDRDDNGKDGRGPRSGRRRRGVCQVDRNSAHAGRI